jgi:type I restriction enzyme S subunit
MSKWKTYKLSEIAQMIGGGTPKTTVEEYWNGDIPWLSVVDFGKSVKTVNHTEKSITEKGLKESSTKILKKGQLIISARGTVGEIAMLGRDMAFNQSCYGLNATKETTNEFLYYLVKNSVGKIKQNTHGAVFDTITKQTFENIEVTIPESLDTQNQIAQILTSLDDKIELNLQMNQTLEAMAQALFKEWFVDFNFPNFDGELENGLPKGWRIGSVLEIATLLSGGTPKTDTEEYWNGSINWISAKDITSSNNQFIIETEKTITELGIKKSAAKLLPKFTTIISARGTVGNYCILSKEMAISQSNYGLKSNLNNDFFLFVMVENMILMMKAFSYGTVFDTITTKTFQEMEVTIPDEKVIKEFETVITPLYEKILANQFQIQTLTQTRDTLLPKLMSGKIAIK